MAPQLLCWFCTRKTTLAASKTVGIDVRAIPPVNIVQCPECQAHLGMQWVGLIGKQFQRPEAASQTAKEFPLFARP